MINHEKRFIFIRVPRTGSTSLSAYLSGIKGTINGAHQFLSRPTDDQSRPSLLELCAGDAPPYFKFGFVRNPWDWVVSRYFTYSLDYRLRHPFKEWVYHYANPVLSAKDVNQSLFNPLCLQSDWLASPDGKLGVDFIGRFENLHNDVGKILKRISGPQDKKLPHEQKTLHKHYSTYYDRESRDLIEKRYNTDISTFNYKFTAHD